jgi:hypothetical protein
MSYWEQEILPVELVAYWKLDETQGEIASDSANDNDGTVYGDHPDCNHSGLLLRKRDRRINRRWKSDEKTTVAS